MESVITNIHIEKSRAKAKRAKEHIAALNNALRFFGEAHPHTVVKNDNTGAVKFRANFPERIRLSWGCMIGDCAHNLRTALDYLICEDVKITSGTILHGTGFPIVKRRKKFETTLTRKLDGASSKAVKLVRRLKPYLNGIEEFVAIQELDNCDKHEIITPVLTSIRGVAGLEVVGGIRAEIFAEDPGGQLEDGDLIAEHVLPGAETDYYLQIALHVAFAEPEIVKGQAVLATLRKLAQFTDRIIDIFGRQIFK